MSTRSCSMDDCEHDEVYQFDICCKAFCEDHCLPDLSGVIECVNCIDHISVQDGSLFIKEGTTVSDTTRWLNFVYNNPNTEILRLLVNINKDKKRKSMENKLTPQKVVKHFVNQFDVAEKHVFVIDNYYGSIGLAQEMHKEGRYFLMSCKSDRPSDIFKNRLHKGLKRNEFKWLVDPTKSIIASSFFDKRICNFVSNVCGQETVESSKRNIPSMVHHYNFGMQGVDRFDRFCSSYKICPHKNVSWKRAAFLAFLKMAMVNSYLLFKLAKRKPRMTQREFIEKVLDQWATRLGFQSLSLGLRNLPMMHMIAKCTKDKIKGRCVSCMQGWSIHRPRGGKRIKFGEPVRSNTRYFCRTCKLWLHPECAYRFHHKLLDVRHNNQQITFEKMCVYE